MRNIDGSPTKRSERCDKVAKTVMALESDFAKSSPRKSKTAIYFDDKNDLLMRLEAMPAGLPIIEHIEDEYEYSYKKAIIGAHAYLRRLGHSADYVIKDDDLTQYSLVIVSCLEMTDESVAENLKAYAANGGTLFIEYPFACRDDITWVTPMRPNSGLDELTGCREIERTVFSEDAGDKIFFGDKEEQVDGWHVTLDVKDVEIIGRWEDGTPAVVCKKFGKGTVITSAGSFSMMGHNKPSDDVPSIYRKILTEAGLDINESALWSYSRYSENYEYRFIFNTSEKKETVEITGELAYATAECKVTETNVTLPLYGTAIMKIKL